MCGIVGVIHFDRRPVDRDALQRMCASLAHRGPDGHGLETPLPWVGLAHRRLSIIDVEGGSQPLCNEDGSVWITFNGEIFNHRELRDDLVARGHRFRTRSDTEVIVHLYEELGPACVERLDGQFAFAIWDGERLFCARDPLGIKPFHYTNDGRRFAFASEPRALLALPGFESELDLESLHLYMRYRFIPAPCSALRGVRKLRAGEWLSIDRDGRERRHLYWSLDRDALESRSDVDAATTELRQELARSVESQLVADVEVGAFLSGGLDSSSVARLMADTRSEPIRTFSIGFDEPRYDERRYAAEMAEQMGSKHVVRVFGPESARGVMTDVLDHMDEPFGDSAILPTLAVSRLARESVKVVLSGDGGDELFGGYGRYYRALQLLAIPPPLRPFRALVRRLSPPPEDPARWRYADTDAVERLYHGLLVRISNRALGRLYGPAMQDTLGREGEDPVRDLLDRVRGMPPLSRVLAIDLNSILSEYHLVKVDRASMQASLEVRVPYLDPGFVNFAFSLAAPVKLLGGANKGLVRRALRNDLPESVLSRSKRGFGPPLRYWFAGELARFARERLDGARVVEEGLLDARGVEALLRPKKGSIRGSRLWRVLVLEAWLRNLREGRLTAGV
jgi:asparagine synthase (glutamine-hydrolysing)